MGATRGQITCLVKAQLLLHVALKRHFVERLVVRKNNLQCAPSAMMPKCIIWNYTQAVSCRINTSSRSKRLIICIISVNMQKSRLIPTALAYNFICITCIYLLAIQFNSQRLAAELLSGGPETRGKHMAGNKG